MTDQMLKDIEADILMLEQALEEDEYTAEEEVVTEEVLEDEELEEGTGELAIDDELDLDKVMKDHAALLLQIDNVLVKSEGSQPVILIEEEEEVEEEQEDYFKGMAEFVASEENDLEGLYDLLQVNLEYQDFINRLLAAIQEKIEHSTQQQVSHGNEVDMQFNRMIQTGKNPKVPICRIMSLQRFKAPYFCNVLREGPKPNQDEIRLRENDRFLMYKKESMWGKTDKKALLEAVRNVVVQEKMSTIAMSRTKEESDVAMSRIEGLSREEIIRSAKIEQWEYQEWNEVSQELASLGYHRSVSDVRQQWFNVLEPSLSTTDWSPSEDAKLFSLVAQHGPHNWRGVSEELGSKRAAWQCLQRYQAVKSKPVTVWSAPDDQRLYESVRTYGEYSYSDMSYYMGDKTPMQCLHRWKFSLKPTIKRGRWTKEDDDKVEDIVAEEGFNWQKLREVVKDRTRAQVRERLRILAAYRKEQPGATSGPWSIKEAFEMMRLLHKYGDTKWAKIRQDMNFKYTCPTLYRRWLRIQSFLSGNARRVLMPWESDFIRELLEPGIYLTDELHSIYANMLPNDKVKDHLKMLLLGHLCKNKPVNKRAHHHSDSASEDEPELVHDVTDEDEYLAVRQNAGKLYRQAFEVDAPSNNPLCYTPPSIVTVEGFKTLLCEEYPKLKAKAGMSQDHQSYSLPEEVTESEEFKLLAARFNSLFSWPLIMGETPVV